MDRNHISHIRFYRPGPRARLAPKGRADTSLPIPIEETYPVRRNKGPLTRYYYLCTHISYKIPRFKHVDVCLRCTHPHTTHSKATTGSRPAAAVHHHTYSHTHIVNPETCFNAAPPRSGRHCWLLICTSSTHTHPYHTP